MPEFQVPFAGLTDAQAFDQLDEIAKGYCEAMFFTADAEIEAKSFADLAPETLARIKSDCEAFRQRAVAMLSLAYARDYDARQAGRDFWFTRNGHGIGFWDRPQLGDDLGERLSEAARWFSQVEPYAGDDGKIYIC